MLDQKTKADLFRKLHVRGHPLVLFNVWDAGSAKAVASAGAVAIATGSWSVAAANGYADGEQIPFERVVDNLSRIVLTVDLPVSIDIEGGYGQSADAVAESIARTVKAGAIGCNLEDSFPENGKLRHVAEQVERIRYARRTVDALGVPYFINARCDLFFQPSQAHDEAGVAGALERARAYADAGADGLFVPGLVDEGLISSLAASSPLPLNVMFVDKTPSLGKLAKAGVARISYGPGPYLRTMKVLEESARSSWAS